MNVVLWVVAALLAAAFLASGAMKLLQPKEKLAAFGLAWVEDFSAGTIKTIGVLEVLAAIGLILPPVLGVAPVLAAAAALGLVLLMLGAALTHVRRKEAPGIATTVFFAILALGRGLGPFRAVCLHRLAPKGPVSTTTHASVFSDPDAFLAAVGPVIDADPLLATRSASMIAAQAGGQEGMGGGRGFVVVDAIATPNRWLDQRPSLVRLRTCHEKSASVRRPRWA